MNICRNSLNERLVFNHFWEKWILRQRSRQISARCLRQPRDTSGSGHNNAYRAQVGVKSLFPNSTRISFWKWLLAISIVKPSDDSKDIFDLIHQGTVEDLIRFIKYKPKDVNQCHKFGWAPIHVAAVSNKPKQIEVLIKNGADPNISEGFSNSFHISKKLDINLVDVISTRQKYFDDSFNNNVTFQGFTALHYAVILSNIESVKVLMNFGADPFLKSVTGYRPIDLATNVEIFDLLVEYEKNFENIIKMREAEERKRFPLEKRLKEVIVGQENAIKVVASAIRRKENGWTDDEHPLVFLFLGSSGIGKTELAKQIANYLHKGKKDNFIRLDMSEYQQSHEVSKMIGSPPGYIGYNEGGQLTKHLTKNPNAIVLFDEVEKAHRDVLTVLLQLFDEGRLTDGKGKTIECKNAIFIMTSNLASEVIAEHALFLRKEQHENKLKEDSRLSDNKIKTHEVDEEMIISRQFKDNIVKPILKRHFLRDEFLGRINEIVYFLPFSEKELKTIVQWELKHWQELALWKHKVKIEWDSAVEHVLIGAYDVSYGARSIKHEVERSVVAQLAKAHEKGLIKENAVIKIVADTTKGDYGTVFLKILHNNKFLNVDDIAI